MESEEDDEDDFDEDFEGRNDYCHMYECPMEKVDEVIHFINILGTNPELQMLLKQYLSPEELADFEKDLQKGQTQYQEWLAQQ